MDQRAKKILVISDDDILTPVIIEFINSFGNKFVVEQAQSATVALSRVKKFQYDCILLGDTSNDHKTDLYDVAIEIKNSLKNKKALVIGISSHLDTSARIMTLLGAHALQADITNASTLKEQLETWLGVKPAKN